MHSYSQNKTLILFLKKATNAFKAGKIFVLINHNK